MRSAARWTAAAGAPQRQALWCRARRRAWPGSTHESARLRASVRTDASRASVSPLHSLEVPRQCDKASRDVAGVITVDLYVVAGEPESLAATPGHESERVAGDVGFAGVDLQEADRLVSSEWRPFCRSLAWGIHQLRDVARNLPPAHGICEAPGEQVPRLLEGLPELALLALGLGPGRCGDHLPAVLACDGVGWQSDGGHPLVVGGALVDATTPPVPAPGQCPPEPVGLRVGQPWSRRVHTGPTGRQDSAVSPTTIRAL